MRFLRLCLALGFAALAPVVALQSLANAKLPLPPAEHWNGFRTASFALTRLEVGDEIDGGMPQFAVRDPGPELARRAFASEPLASNALFVLAVNARQTSGEEVAREIIQLAGQLELRNRYLGVLRMQDAVADGDIDTAFAVLDQFTLVNPELAGPLVLALSPLLNDAASRASLREALEREPAWAADYWLFAPRNPDAVPGLLDLRSRIDVGTSSVSDAMLLKAAVEQKRFGEALAMWERVVGSEADTLAYRADELHAPIGWAFEQDARKSVNITRTGGYRIFVAANSSGAIGRQLVRLRPGTYVLELEGDDRIISRLQSALLCVDSEANPRWQAGAEETRFTVSGECSIHWLILGADAFEQSNPLEGMLSRMNFRRVG